ncbi:hypothetical protein [Solihabitans fulvus]|uniref:hypothetical protein n=1 Tax=Solihabitans fulvus TaxID=1892852 RepID=UPI001661A36C|nr:hypothetical protein [Solihabitans fulvus]
MAQVVLEQQGELRKVVPALRGEIPALTAIATRKGSGTLPTSARRLHALLTS